jgi:hypothetical protein
MKLILGAPFVIVYLLLGLVQIAATASGIQHFSDLWRFVSWWIAMFIGWTPLVGTALGIYGAHADWGWSLMASFSLFLGIPLLFVLIGGIAAVMEAVASRR